MTDRKQRSVDPASRQMIDISADVSIELAFDRYEAMQPQCGFGELGICCRICTMGPCRIDPFGEGPRRGICGASADIIAARNLVRMIAAGSAAHSDHGRDIAHTLLMAAEGKGDYKVKGEDKVRALARELGIPERGRSKEEVAHDVAELAFSQFGQQHGELQFTKRAPEDQRRRWRESGVMPRGIDREIVEIMHRTHMGVDNDPRNIILQGVRAALADGWGGSMIATELSDVLFGLPHPLRSQVNLGVLKEENVNIIVHGHEPTLSDMIVAATQDPELIKLAEQKGAKGITLAGICCTSNEILMRHGIPIAGNFLQQELAVVTGVVDAMVVDVQCVFPSLGELTSCFHTRFISTSPKAKFPYAQHIEFREDRAMEIAKEIVRTGIENYPNRKGKATIPDVRNNLIAGFTAESIYEFLGGRFRATYRPLNDAVISGRLRGAAAIVGCNNPRHCHDYGHLEMAKELLRHDVIILTTGCSAIASAKAGLLRPEAAEEWAGEGLREICRAVGIPPVLHLGSCVDISRILTVCCNVVSEGGLGMSMADLPVAGAAPEWMSEKAVAIGFYVIASGVYTVLGTNLPVLGSKEVMDFICGDIEKIFGGRFEFEPDPVKAAQLMIAHIDRKRKELNLRPAMYSALELDKLSEPVLVG